MGIEGPLSLTITILVFSLIILGMSNFMGDIGNNYGLANDTENLSSLSKIHETLNLTSDIQTKLVSTSTSSSSPLTDLGLFFFNGAIDALRLLYGSIGIFASLIRDVATTNTIMPIPSEVISVVVGIVMIIIVLTGLSALLRTVIK